jgi:hypothetical protein
MNFYVLFTLLMILFWRGCVVNLHFTKRQPHKFSSLQKEVLNENH